MKVCPIGCQNPGYAKAPEHIVQKLRNCVFLCPNKTNGCTKDISYDEIAQHELTCPFKLVKCSGFQMCKMICLRMDMYSHESLCPYSAINQKLTEERIERHADSQKSGCRGCVICQNRSECFSFLATKVESNHSELFELINNLTNLVKLQDEKIKELKLRLEKVEDQRDGQ